MSRSDDAPHLDHLAIVVQDLQRSLMFYRDILGMEMIHGGVFTGRWEPILGVDTAEIRTVMLCEPRNSQGVVLELIHIPPTRPDVHREGSTGQGPDPAANTRRTFMLSFLCRLDTTMDILRRHGFTVEEFVPTRSADREKFPMLGFAVGPDGEMVELIDHAADTVAQQLKRDALPG